MSRIDPGTGCVRGAKAVVRLRRVVSCVLVGLFLAVWCHWETPPTQPTPGRGVPSPVRATSNRSTTLTARPEEAGGRETAFPVPNDAEAWGYLPTRVRGDTAPLPLWARVLARSLPRTTAAMLELDFAHRATSPLDPKLRGQVRWAAARANRCAYGEAYALADLRAAGTGEDELRELTGDSELVPAETRKILLFVRLLIVNAQAIRDEEVADLVARHGEGRMVAIVLCAAYANFLDRLVLALNLSVEPGGPRPPLDVRFARRGFGAGAAPPRTPPGAAPPEPSGLRDPDWRAAEWDTIRCGVEAQKTRRARIALPGADPAANRWGLVGRSYQPTLATAWATCTQAFAEEADPDPVFEQSVFWVVTRTKQCFY